MRTFRRIAKRAGIVTVTSGTLATVGYLGLVVAEAKYGREAVDDPNFAVAYLQLVLGVAAVALALWAGWQALKQVQAATASIKIAAASLEEDRESRKAQADSDKRAVLIPLFNELDANRLAFLQLENRVTIAPGTEGQVAITYSAEIFQAILQGPLWQISSDEQLPASVVAAYRRPTMLAFPFSRWFPTVALFGGVAAAVERPGAKLRTFVGAVIVLAVRLLGRWLAYSWGGAARLHRLDIEAALEQVHRELNGTDLLWLEHDEALRERGINVAPEKPGRRWQLQIANWLENSPVVPKANDLI